MRMLNQVKHRAVTRILENKFPLDNHRIPGFMNHEDSYFLYSSVLFSRPNSIMEIGHYLGKSTAAICQAIRDANLQSIFYSFDLPYPSTEAFESYYTEVHGRKISASSSYSNILNQGKIFTTMAQENLESVNLENYVELFSKDFRDSKISKFDLIFADVLHDKAEIFHNIHDVTEFGHDSTLYMFDDMNLENIRLVETHSNLKLIRKTGKIGAFRFG